MFATNIREELSSKFAQKSWKVADYEKLFVLFESPRTNTWKVVNGYLEHIITEKNSLNADKKII